MAISMNTSQELYNRFMYLINNNVVLHNDKLDIDYVLKKVEVQEELFSCDQKVKVWIDILDDTDKELLKQIDTLQERVLGELLPTKRPEKFAGEEW